MRKSTYSQTQAAFEEVAPYDVSTCSDTPVVILWRASAGNDAVGEDWTRTADDAEPWIIMAAIRAVGAIARRAHARHRQRQQARAVYDALRQLDDRTLRDLGFDRSEITSVAAEVTGEAERTRVRALLMSHVLP
jgi:uncharacterized protein YjiS (DUF1127 family)